MGLAKKRCVCVWGGGVLSESIAHGGYCIGRAYILSIYIV